MGTNRVSGGGGDGAGTNRVSPVPYIPPPPVPPFSPSDIAGLKVWLKADADVFSDAGVTPAVDTDPVQQWNDQSGNANNISQAVAGFRPIFLTNIINSLPVVRCDGVDDRIGTALAASISQPATLIAVLKIRADFFDIDLGTVPGTVFLARGAVNADELGISADGGVSSIDYPLAVPSPFFISSSIFNGASSEIRENGVVKATGDAGVGTITNFFWGSVSGVAVADMDVAEVVLYDSALSDSNRASVEAYLTSKYAL